MLYSEAFECDPGYNPDIVQEDIVCAAKALQEKPSDDPLPCTNQPIEGASAEDELESNAYD